MFETAILHKNKVGYVINIVKLWIFLLSHDQCLPAMPSVSVLSVLSCRI